MIIGAGLAGLSAAIRLERAGLRTLVLERREVAGGLCGSRVLDGYEFVYGCNDFSSGIERRLHALGVDLRFRRLAMRCFSEEGCLELPPRGRSLLRLAAMAPGLARLLLALRAEDEGDEGTVGELLDRRVRDVRVHDLVALVAYASGTSPARLPLSALKADFSKELGYGHQQFVVPEGGPPALARAMVGRLEALGGRLLTSTPVRALRRAGVRHEVVTDHEVFSARHVVTSQGRWDEYPAESEAGLAVGALFVAVRSSLAYPAGVHTMAWTPRGMNRWLEALLRGELPRDFGFHFFRPLLPAPRDHYTLTFYVYFPRGLDEADEALQRTIEDHIGARAEAMLPGLGQATLYRRFVSPRAYRQLFGLGSQPVPRILLAGATKPPSYCPERDLYFVGNSVQPPGEHAGGAVLSGLMVAAGLLGRT